MDDGWMDGWMTKKEGRKEGGKERGRKTRRKPRIKKLRGNVREMKSSELGVDGGLSFCSQALGTFPSICGPHVPRWM